ncbi:MAG: ABC transporter permease [Oscillospiraceae bacterium]|nr:ABC transporter permease [Oscillospiraceae bacterium]
MNVKNRKCIRKLSWRSLWASRKRNIIAIIAIALTALLFTSLFTIVMSINSSYENYTFRQVGGYSHGTFKEVTQEQAQAIAGHPKVKAVGVRTTIGFMDSGVFAKVPAEVSCMDENCTQWSFAEPTTGHMPQSGKEITMDTAALKLLGIQPELGTKITLTYTVGDQNQLSYEKTDTFTLVGWWDYDDICPVHYVNISEEYARAVEAEGMAAGMAPFRTDLNVMMASSLDIRGQMEQVDLDLGYTWETRGEENSVRIGVNWGYTSAQLGESIDATTLIAIIAFLALVIFTGYLIIYNIFQISVTGDIRFYGLLKTIGVTPRQLKRIIRQQALFLCIVGIPVGLLLGYGVGASLTPVVMAQTTFGVGVSTVSTSPLIFFASALFALITVLLSCARPGKIASKVSPVEATKYTEIVKSKKKQRTTRGAKVHQMAFANLGRNKRKTALVVISLSLSVVLLNMLVTFTGGFDMEKYLAKLTCADFIVSSTDYFRYNYSSSYISQEQIEQIEGNTAPSLSGCGYTLTGYFPYGWMSEEHWLQDMMHFTSEENARAMLEQSNRRGDLVGQSAMMEGLDDSLFDKLTVVEGDISPMFQKDTNAIAVVVNTDDYGNVGNLDFYPPVGSTQTITYIDEGYYIDSRTGNLCDENTPAEYVQLQLSSSHDVDYTVCAYVIVPYSMSSRHYSTGYSFVLPIEKLNHDSEHESIPMFYLFDTPDDISEASAENYLADLTADNLSGLMYESKATLRAEFEGFQTMFLLLGGLLCAIIGLIGVLNFFNAIMTGILSRKREFAVLQAVGMTNKQLKAMLIYEGLFYSLSSAVAALALSFILNPLVGDLLENMFWFFSAKFTIVPVLLAIPVFALLGWLIPYAMYAHAAKYSIVEQLRDTQ